VENYAPPVITSSGFQNDLMHVAWTAGRNWPRYNVRWERDNSTVVPSSMRRMGAPAAISPPMR